ncbi:MAG: recombinase family protein [Clostridiales bacterium]|nr:recombinase family protein [Clostridiales bacterium]
MSEPRIAAYMRISVDVEKDRDNTSIENQREIIEAYVKQKFPDSEVNYYADRGRSGYTFKQREQYQLMRPLLMNGYYKILIVKDFSRFARRNSHGLVELEDLRDAGIRIIAIGNNVDYPTYDDWYNIQIRFLMNEMPVTDASKKVKNVIKQRQSNGTWICKVPFGYVLVDTKNMAYEVDEKSADTVREIFRLYNNGWGYKKIAIYLTDQKRPTPRMVEKERKEREMELLKINREIKIKARPEWSVATICGILSNDFYIGTLREWKYTRTNINGTDKKLDDAENIVFENHHPPIVDVREFMKAQQQRQARTRSNYRGVKKYDTNYSGFLFCGDCGSPMFSMSRPDLAPAYICGTYHKRGKKAVPHTILALIHWI